MTPHAELHHWRLVYPTAEMDEPHHDVSIRENRPGALELVVVDAAGRPGRRVNLRGGWCPIWYRCRGFGSEARKTKAIVFGRARDEGDGVQVEIECLLDGTWAPEVPTRYIDRLAIAAQTLKIKG